MQVLQVCAYGAEYPGNFIASLEALEKKLKEFNVETIYAFVKKAENKYWCKEIQKRTKVYFLPEAKARILPETYRIMRKIYQENDVAIVHTHFELYDIPTTILAPKGTKIFWHLHDPINPQKNLRGLIWKIQYGIIGKRAKLLAVAEYYRELVVSLGFSRKQTYLILNSIDLNRINDEIVKSDKKYDFLTFGWDFYRKGDDLILQACDKLEEEGYSFKLLLNGNEKTWEILEKHLNGKNPSYLVKCNPVENVNEFFDNAKVFVQASRKETFSYAVCEAAYAGLPVISSDIEGLKWAHDLISITFFENENVEQLYQLMKCFLDGYKISEDSLMKTKKLIQEKYSLGVWVNNILKQYEIEE